MSIYPDKKDGKLTGRFRVEVQGRRARYRCRCDSIGEARAKDAEFKALAADGILPPPASTRVGGRPSATPAFQWPAGTPAGLAEAFQAFSGTQAPQPSEKLSWCIQEASGRIWKNAYTSTNNEGHLAIMLGAMGDCELNEIDDTWVLDLKETLKETRTGRTGDPISDGTINRYLATLSTFLQYAIDKKWRTIKALPKLEYAAENAGRIRWFTPQEEADLYRLLPERSAKAVGIDIRTGLRRMELLSMEADQITPGFAHIWKTKSGSPRTVPLTAEDEKDLRWLCDGNMPTYTQLRQDWAAARMAMGLDDDPYFVFHACRHTFATRAVQANVPIRVLQELLGHKTIEMTERYAHVHDEMKTQARDRMFGVAAPELEAEAA